MSNTICIANNSLENTLLREKLTSQGKKKTRIVSTTYTTSESFTEGLMTSIMRREGLSLSLSPS